MDENGSLTKVETIYNFTDFENFLKFLDPTQVSFANNPVKINRTFKNIAIYTPLYYIDKETVDIEITDDVWNTTKVEVVLKYNCDNQHNVTFASFEKFIIEGNSFTDAQAMKVFFE